MIVLVLTATGNDVVTVFLPNSHLTGGTTSPVASHSGVCRNQILRPHPLLDNGSAQPASPLTVARSTAISKGDLTGASWLCAQPTILDSIT